MRKLIFFDIDGTLTGEKERGKIYDSTKEALRRLEANGHFVAIATGRAHFRAMEFLSEINMKHMVCEGGNCIVMNNETIAYEPLDQTVMKAIYYEAMAKGMGVAVAIDDSRIRVAPNHLFIEHAGDYHYLMDVVVDEHFDIETAGQIRRLFLAISEEQQKTMKSLEKIGFMRYKDDKFVIIEPDDKYKGIKKICEILQEDEQNVVVFGDGLNDRKMFRDAPFAIAMGNALPELKEMADYVTADSDHDGIYLACKHFHWI